MILFNFDTMEINKGKNDKGECYKSFSFQRKEKRSGEV